MIYFVRRASDQAIKIGTTIRLTQRFKVLCVEHGECEVLAVMDGSYADEAVIHRQFCAASLGGEWFIESPSLLEFIATEGRPWAGEDEIAPLRSARLPTDILKMARVVAALTDRKVEDVIGEIARPLVLELYRAELAKAESSLDGGR